MRTGHVSFAALATAAALTVSAWPGLVSSSFAQSTPPTEGAASMPAPVGINWPPSAPPLDVKPEAPAAAAPVSDAKPATAASVEVPASGMSLPATAPSVDAPAPKPAFALAAELGQRLRADKSDVARADRDAAVKFYTARQGAPVWVTETGYTPQAKALMAEIRSADAYGLPPSAYRLPADTLAADTAPEALADAEATLTLAALKYARHARGGRLDPGALTEMFDRKPQLIAPDTVLATLSASAKPAEALRGMHPKHPQFEKLRLKYVAVKSGQAVLPPPPAPVAPSVPEVVAATPGKAAPKAAAKKSPAPPAQPTNAQLERKLLANMEMYRWMPEMGDTFVQNNIPEFMTRMYRGGKLVHAERIVTGKPETPTPIFSNEFAIVVFKPFWNVPESIKWKELQPQLERGGGQALEKVGLRAAYNGKEVDPRTINWAATDLRQFHVYQPPGAANALGQVKFLFPNKHDVYMHDTPSKNLFNNPARAYSHGCMRVRDPLKFAEMLLGPDKGWDAAMISKLANAGPENNEVRLNKKLPIHVTYFTTVVEDDGTLKLHKDIYDHETKVHLGLEGKAHLIVQAKAESEKAPPRRPGGIIERQQQSSSWGSSSSGKSDLPSWARTLFNF